MPAACELRYQHGPAGYMLDANNNLIAPTPNQFTLFRMMNKGKGWTTKRMASEYRKAQSGETQKLDVRMTDTLAGPQLAIRPATGRYSRTAYVKQLKPVPVKTVDDQFKEMVGMNRSNVQPKPYVSSGKGTFKENYLNPRPNKVRPNFHRNPEFKPKRPDLTYETLALKDVAPNAYRVFVRLHAGNDEFMKSRQSRAAHYREWRDNFYKEYKYNKKDIVGKLNRILNDERYVLNPSRRTLPEADSDEKHCKGKTCWYEDGKGCVEPTADHYVKTIPKLFRDTQPPYIVAAREKQMREDVANNRVDLCAYGRRYGEDRYYESNLTGVAPVPAAPTGAAPANLMRFESDSDSDSDYRTASDSSNEEEDEDLEIFNEFPEITMKEINELLRDQAFQNQLQEYKEEKRGKLQSARKKGRATTPEKKVKAEAEVIDSARKFRGVNTAIKAGIQAWIDNGRRQYVYVNPQAAAAGRR